MSVISVSHLKKFYQVHQKEAGLLGSVKSLFVRRYEKIKAVDDISFEIAEGELVGFIGPNGAGKTTTLKCLAGLLYPTSGGISVLDFNPVKRQAPFLKQISLIMGQKNQLWWDLPPTETFLLNKAIYEIDGEKFKKTLADLVELLEIGSLLQTPTRKLSLGQRMRCELAASLLHLPKVLFLDEPTIGLDVVMQKKIRDFVREYNRRFRATILLTSHYMKDVEDLCKRVIIIDKGKIIYDGQLSSLVKKFASYKTLSVIFEKEIDLQKLVKIGEIKSYHYPKAVIAVSRSSSNLAAAELLQNFPIADLNIEEPEIEEVIRQIFSGESLQES
ncbi:MAG: ABC transporter ATP-binding protein [bacterium]|nr:ABC transporter ATP-binding protein [bacterium]